MKISEATKEEHDSMMAVMRQFFEEKPQVGLFYVDIVNNRIVKYFHDDADKYISNDSESSFHKDEYTSLPRGRVFVKQDGSIYVKVGDYLNDEIRERIADTFNLPDDFETTVDPRYNGSIENLNN